MTRLTDQLQAIGYSHKCEGATERVYSISENEAIAARDMMKQKCIDAVMSETYDGGTGGSIFVRDVIKAIMDIK